MKNKKIKILATCLLATMVIGQSSMAYAATPALTNSIASSATDKKVGADATQGQSTAYSEETIKSTTYNGTNAVTVYATKTGWAKVTIPKTLILGPDATTASKYTCAFDVAVEGDIAGAQSVTVSPADTCSLSEVNGKTTAAACTVTLDDKKNLEVSANDLLNGKIVHATGKVTATNVAAGTYKANVNFGVIVNYGN